MRLLLLLTSIVALAKTDLTVQATATQALFTYDGDNTAACTLDVRESGAGSVVNDVNSTLFSGANLDSRHAWNVGKIRRNVIVGLRTAQTALDSSMYSRALQANTLHTYSITCASTTVTGTFSTMNPPIGNTYPDLLPVDPLSPGNYAYPTVPSSGAYSYIDERTGFKLFRMAKAYDAGLSLTACGDCDLFDNSWSTKVSGPGGVLGYHGIYGRVMYWIDPATPAFNVLGTPTPAYNPTDGTHVGWSNTTCIQNYWIGPNRLACLTYNPSEVSSTAHAFDTILLAMDYTGGNTDLGPLSDMTPVTLCGSTPCWTVTDVTDPSHLLSLNAKIRAATPEYDRAGFGRGSSVQLSGRMGSTGKVNMSLRKTSHQDTLGMMFVFDPATSTVSGIVQSYAVWPARWAGYHGFTNINDPTWIQSPNTPFRGTLSGNDEPGNGPYISVATGSIPATPGACGTAGTLPAGSLPWPTGNRCTTIAVDGEPADPSPAFYNTGTIVVSGTTAAVGTSTVWDQTIEGKDIKLGASWRKVAVWIDATHLTLDSLITYSGAYAIYLEPVNNSKTGNPLWAYLQDAAPGDLFFISAPSIDIGNTGNGVGYVGSGFSVEAEPVRLLSRSGLNWLVQRGWSGDNSLPKPSQAWASGSWLTAMPATCASNQTYTCVQSQSYTDGTQIVVDQNDAGCCHGTFQNGAMINLANVNIPTIDGLQPFHWSRNAASIPGMFAATGYPVSLCGSFNGILGECVPNAAETHPSHNNLDTSWVTDGRPYLGSTDSGSAGCPATLVSGSLYKFSASSNCLTRLRRRVLPTMASCGWHPLLDISSTTTGNVIGTTSGGGSDQWKYCTALAVNECRTGSAVGDVFMNCPGTTVPYSQISANGVTNPTGLDLNISDMGSTTHAITQTTVNLPDYSGAGARRITTAMGQWKRGFTAFWHPECLPGGEMCMVYVTNGSDTVDTIWAVKMLPIPPKDSINRADYATTEVRAKSPTGLSVDNVVVRYGYDSNYRCRTRQEPCMAGNTSGVIWESETPAGVAADGGGIFKVNVPALSQRIMYYQVVMRNSSNVALSSSDMQFKVIQ